MKKLLVFLLVITMSVCAIFSFAGCDTIVPLSSTPSTGSPNTDDPNSDDPNSDNPNSDDPSSDNPNSDDPNSDDPNNDDPSGSGENSEEDQNVPVKQWSFDDDYHWHTEADKALHTVTSGVCTVCGEEVTHTVGLEYELITPATNTVARLAVPCNLDYEISNDGSYYVVKSIGVARGDIVVPGTYNGIPVKEIGEKAFYAHDQGRPIYDPYHTTSVVLSEGIEKIGYYAFAWTKDLTNFVFPSTLTTIGERAFEGTGIESIFIPKTVTTIEDCAFYSNSGPKIHLGRSVEEMQEIEVGEAAFKGTSVYYRTEAKIGEAGHYWYYDNGNIVEYTNWAGMKTTWDYWELVCAELSEGDSNPAFGSISLLDPTTLVVELTSYDKVNNIVNCKVYEKSRDDNTVVTAWTENERCAATTPSRADWSTWRSTFVKQVSYGKKTYSISYEAEVNLDMHDDLGLCSVELVIVCKLRQQSTDELTVAVMESFPNYTVRMDFGSQTAYLVVR